MDWEELEMPSISMFYGIIITMFNNGREHNPPHFHASYSGAEAVFDLDGDILSGDFPAKQKHLIKAWAVLHKDELEANWKLCMEMQSLYPIDPLK